MIGPSMIPFVLGLVLSAPAAGPLRPSGGSMLACDLRIGNSPQERIFCAQGLAPLGDGGLVVSDRLDYRMKVFDAAGSMVARVGGRGKQDGSFRGPGPVDCSARAVAVADFASDRIQLFSRSFRHQQTLHLPGYVSDLCFDRRGALWVSIVRPDNRGELLRYTPDGAPGKRISMKGASGNPFHDVCSVAPTPDGEILAAYLTRNVVEVYDSAGNFLRQFGVAGLPSMPPAAGLNTGEGMRELDVPAGVLIWNVTVDRRGRIYLLAGDCSEYPGMEVMVLRQDGTYARSLWLPERAVRIRAGEDDEMWAVVSSRDSVIRCRIVRGGSDVL